MTRGNFRDKALLVLALLFICVAGGGAAALQARTLVHWYSIWGPATIIGITFAVSRALRLYKEKRYDVSQSLLYGFILAAVLTSALGAATLGLNYIGRKEEKTRHIEATVVNRYSATRTQSSRRGRRTYGPRHTYKVYYITIQFPDGRVKDRQVSLEKFNSTKTAHKLPATVTPGLLGMDIINVE